MVKNDAERMTEKELKIKIQTLEARLPSFLASIESAGKEFTTLTTARSACLAARAMRAFSNKLAEATEEIMMLESGLKSR
jgi:hypothetical protein